MYVLYVNGNGDAFEACNVITVIFRLTTRRGDRLAAAAALTRRRRRRAWRSGIGLASCEAAVVYNITVAVVARAN